MRHDIKEAYEAVDRLIEDEARKISNLAGIPGAATIERQRREIRLLAYRAIHMTREAMAKEQEPVIQA
jgi:hypothetical protein